jgi:glycogen synthase
MRVAMVTWEYPPLVVGGISPHVDGLSSALVRAGHDVVVLTLAHPDAPSDCVVDGVRVLRAPADQPWLPEDGFVARMASANHHLVRLSARLAGWRPDVVHAHDWLVAWAGDTLSALWDVPMVATVHATERGRGGGHVPPGQPSAISSVEWWLTYQARQVIACSHFMVREVVDAFSTPADKVHMVPNGVDADVWAPPAVSPPTRGRGDGTEGPLVVSWGRVQHEKGFQTLVDAAAMLRYGVPGLRVVVAGRGGHLDALRNQADHLGVGDIVHFAGFVPDEHLRAMLHRANAVVIPSFYEPFGIVALEALAARAPLVAAASGGLAEILTGTDAALLYPPGDAGALADRLRRLLHDPASAKAQQDAGDELVRSRYSWDAVAAQTVPVYELAGHPR